MKLPAAGSCVGCIAEISYTVDVLQKTYCKGALLRGVAVCKCRMPAPLHSKEVEKGGEAGQGWGH